ncbi:MAG: hypothetical protein JO287_03970 [Pseudonocardiales bacterium]|nr:hypothetical protein [Pseudonocardiales bacterium]
MFGRKRPDSAVVEQTHDSERTTSYRVDQDAAPVSSNVDKTSSYVNAMQKNGRGYETLN